RDQYLSLRCFSYGYADHRDLHSFPTRRSSDLLGCASAWYASGACDEDSRTCSGAGGSSTLAGRRALGLVVCRSRSAFTADAGSRSEEHTSELQSRENLVCRLLLEKKKKQTDD